MKRRQIRTGQPAEDQRRPGRVRPLQLQRVGPPELPGERELWRDVAGNDAGWDPARGGVAPGGHGLGGQQNRQPKKFAPS